uniref:Uncharacterized protein n=1 Tax=Ascaris lumbricoides TaxID=6252 RepID=A0A0M3I0L7_ASCLU
MRTLKNNANMPILWLFYNARKQMRRMSVKSNALTRKSVK